jgi:hypothetical protein
MARLANLDQCVESNSRKRYATPECHGGDRSTRGMPSPKLSKDSRKRYSIIVIDVVSDLLIMHRGAHVVVVGREDDMLTVP